MRPNVVPAEKPKQLVGTALTFALAGLLGPLSLAVSGAAAESPRSYENQRVQKVLAEQHFKVDENAEGKPISFIKVVRNDVFVEDEIWPLWWNLFHFFTDEDVIARELLFHRGERYRTSEIEETMRNLRKMGVFSLVSIVPIHAADDGEVGVLVYTRDLWSLRLEQSFNFTGDKFDYLSVQLTERNLFSRAKRVSARFHLTPFTYSLGEVYYDRRLWASEFHLGESFDVILNRHTGELEGTEGSLTFGVPMRYLSQHWSFSLTGAYMNSVSRDIVDGKVKLYDVSSTEQREEIPQIWNDFAISSRVTVRYQQGSDYRQILYWGFGFRNRLVSLHSDALAVLEPQYREEFEENVLPLVRQEAYPFIGYEFFAPEFVVFRDLGTFGQSENVRVGPSLILEVELPLSTSSPSQNSCTVKGSAGYVWAGHDAMAEMRFEPSSRFDNGEGEDQLLSFMIRGATPPWLFGRLVAQGTWEQRRNSTANAVVSLGGDNGMRGYPSQAIYEIDGNLILGNLEYRTQPLVWEALHFGGVLFYDVGSVYRRLAEAQIYHSVGLGLRFLFPQFSRYVFRLDLGAPLTRSGFTVLFSFGSSQAVTLTPEEDLAR